MLLYSYHILLVIFKFTVLYARTEVIRIHINICTQEEIILSLKDFSFFVLKKLYFIAGMLEATGNFFLKIIQRKDMQWFSFICMYPSCVKVVFDVLV